MASEADIVERLYAAFSATVMDKANTEEMASLCYEAKHEIGQLREALVAAVSAGGSDDPMVQQHIDTAKDVARALSNTGEQ